MNRLLLGDQPGAIERFSWRARNRLIVAVAFTLGLRASEVGLLRIDEVRIEPGQSLSVLLTLLILVIVSRAQDMDGVEPR